MVKNKIFYFSQSCALLRLLFFCSPTNSFIELWIIPDLFLSKYICFVFLKIHYTGQQYELYHKGY